MILTSLRRFGGRFQAGGRVVLETQTDRTEHGRLRPTAKSTVGYVTCSACQGRPYTGRDRASKQPHFQQKEF